MADKKMTDYQIMSAIATAVYQLSDHTDSKKHNSYQEDAENSYWVCWEEPVSGVKCKFKDNKLVLSFTVETINPLKLDNHYENKINSYMNSVVSEVKKKYKNITGKTLSLTKDSEIFEHVTPLSSSRQLRLYISVYTIGGIESFNDKYKKDVKELLKSAFDKADQMTVFKAKK